MSTLAWYITSLRDLLQEPDSAGRFSDPELTRYVNFGRRRVAEDLRVIVRTGSASLLAGQSEASLPSDYAGFYGWLDVPPDGATIIGNRLLVASPVASDTTLRFRYFALPTDLTDPNATDTEIPARHQDGVVLAAYWAALESDMDARRVEAEARYARWLEQAKRIEGAATYRWPTRIRRLR